LVAVVADWAPLLCFSVSPLTLKVESKVYTDISALRFADSPDRSDLDSNPRSTLQVVASYLYQKNGQIVHQVHIVKVLEVHDEYDPDAL
jgi:hypothetical protein